MDLIESGKRKDEKATCRNNLDIFGDFVGGATPLSPNRLPRA